MPHPPIDTARRRRRASVLLWGAALMLLACAQGRTPLAPAPGAAPAASPTAGAKAVAVVLADVDRDGHVDIVSGSVEPGAITIAYGEGGGRFAAPLRLPVEGDVRALAVADVDEDGLPDIIGSVQRQSSGIRVWLNQPGRQWKPGRAPTEINSYSGVKAVDLNGDGHIDVVAANATSELQGGIQVWWGTGKGSWVPGPSPTVTGIYMDVLAVDVNGDGVLDLAGAGWGNPGGIRVWLGNGAGGWSALDPFCRGSFYALGAADFDADGRLDLVAGSYKGYVRPFRGDGRGGFTEQIALKADPAGEGVEVPDASYWQALPVDLDGDGWVDLVAGSLDNQGVHAWFNRQGKGWAFQADAFPRSGNFYGLAAADWNADGRPEIAAANFGEGVLALASRTGSPAAPEAAARRMASVVPVAAERGGPVENDVFKVVNGVPEYKIGPGDLLEITLWEGLTATRHEVRVRPNGRITFGLAENLTASGLTAAELDERLTAQLSTFLKRPRVSVAVTQHNSRTVRLLGALAKSGSTGLGAGEYKLQGRTTVLESIATAGGPTADADLKTVRVRRKDGETMSLNLYKTILQGDLKQDLVLNDGDVVYLPTLSKDTNRVYVFGEVQKPGAYTFSGPEMRLIDAVSEAGGPTVFAYRSDTRVVRGDITQPEILSADLGRLMESGDRSQNLLLASGDLVYVPRSAMGDVKRFYDQVRPLLEMVLWPARVVIDWNSAADITGAK
jgi:protein involved in polysaccharide export with SLBB domain